MRICGIACVKDSHAILAASIKHLVLNGIRDFYLYDHGSDPHLSSFLSTEFGSDTLRMQVLRKETRPFFQREMVNILGDLAREDGFEIALAFDADEFWCSTVPGRSLADQIAFEIPAEADALMVPVINYVQHRDVDTFHVKSLSKCQYSVVPFVASARHPQDQVDAGMPFVAMPFPSKVIAWLSRDSKYTTGQHDITKTKGEGRIADAAGIIVRHLPLPARTQLVERREQGLRLIAAGFPAWLGWQSQRLAYMTETELDAYWSNNSWHFADDHVPCVGTYDRLVQDNALVQIGHDLTQAGDFLNKTQGAGAHGPLSFREIPSYKFERLIQHIVDDSGKAERTIEALTLARDQAIARGAMVGSELDAVRSELDTVRSELDTIRSERDAVRSERDAVQSKLDTVQSELAAVRSSPWQKFKVLLQGLRPIEKRLREFRKRHFVKRSEHGPHESGGTPSIVQSSAMTVRKGDQQ